MSEFNNTAGIQALRPENFQDSDYFNQIEIVLRQVFDNLNNVHRLPSYEVAILPEPSDYLGGIVYCSDETGGSIPVFSDGTNWRRTSDRVIAS